MRLHNASVPSLLLALCIWLLAAGCSVGTPVLTAESLSRRVNALLGGQDAVTVQAGQLTGFPWQKLCFRRGDGLTLEFQIDGSFRRVPLPYEAFFVDEGQAANSLQDACVTPAEPIVVRRKYPGYAGPVEFQSVSVGNAR